MADEIQVLAGPMGTEGETPRIRVSLLGSMQVDVDGRPMHVAGRQRRRMLALLAMRAGRVVPVEALVDAMWGDDPPPSAGKTVLSHVVRLRQSLAAAGDPIETTPGGYRLAIETSGTDAAHFEELAAAGATELRLKHHRAAAEQLEAALKLWRGPALMEFAELEFARGESVRLEERRLVAIEDLGEARLGTGASATVASDMERVVAEHPGRERGWALLMLALYSSGRQHDALAAFQRARTVLGDEFGLEPSRELRDLERRIVDQDPVLLGPQARSLPAPLRDDRKLVGRTSELDWIRAAWRLARTGVGQVRAVVGAVGSGRTRLAAELAAEVAADGAAVEYVAGAVGLQMLGDGSGPGSVIDAVAVRCHEAPLLLIVDELDWTPLAGIEAVRALATAAERLPLLLLLISSDVDGPALTLLRELERSCCSTLVLAPMSDDDLTALLLADGVDSETAAAAVALASGLPNVARREATAWAERVATERLNAATTRSIGAQSAAAIAGASVFDEVMRLVDARARLAELVGSEWSGRQPYRSLASYGPSDADLFVGRERLVAELTARVLDRRIVAVVGASGSGKSSIVRAGLIPLVRSGRLPGGGSWRAEVIVPGDDPLAAIDGVPHIDEPGAQLLVIDQFEEVAGSDQIDAVAGRLLDLILDPALDARIVIVMRADQIGVLATSRALAELIEDAQVLVGPPSDEEMRRIVVEPARRTGCSVDHELVAMISADVAGHDAALPLVSAAMAEVWERRDGDVLRATAYEEIGGLAAAVQHLGDRALAEVGPAGAPAVRDVMLRLVDVTDEGAWVRRRIASADMRVESRAAIEALVAARLIVHSGDTLDVVHEVVFRAWPQMAEWLEEARSDITLERDLRAAARTWVAEGRSDDVVLRGGRLHAATEWAARCDHVPAVVDDLIAASHEWAERDNRAIREQLVREQQGRRRLRGALIAASLLVVVALIVGLLALDNSRRADRQRDRADAAAIQAAQAANDADAAAADAADAADLAEQQRAEAQTNRLVAESHSNLERNLGLAMLLAVEAHRRAETPQTQGALLSSLTHIVSSVRAPGGACCQSPSVPHVKSSFLGFIAGPVRQTTEMSISFDGRIVATAGSAGWGQPGGSVLVFDSSLRRLIGVVPTTSSAPGVVVRPDGSDVLAVDATVIRLFDTAAAEIVDLDIALPAGTEFTGASYTKDADRLVVTTSDHKVRLFDASTFEPIDAELPDWPDLPGRVAPDGTLAIGTPDGAISFWDLDAHREVRRVVLADTDNVTPFWEFRISPDMRLLAGGVFEGPVVVWSLEDGALVGDPAARPQVARAVAFDPVNPSVLALGSASGGVTMFDVDANRPIGEPLRGLPGGVRALAFSKDGRLLVTTNDDGLLALWTDNAGPTLLSAPIADGHRLVAASVDGEVVVTGGQFHADVHRPGSSDGQPVQIQLRSQRDAPEFRTNLGEDVSDPVPWILSSDGSMLLGGITAGDLAQGTSKASHMWLFDTRTGAVRWTHGESRRIYRPGVSPDGDRVAFVVEDRLVEIWDVATDTVLATFDTADAYPEIATLFTGPPEFVDGNTVAIASTGGAVQFDIGKGELAVGERAGSTQGWIAHAPRNDLVAGGQGGTIMRWNMDDGRLIARGQSFDPTSIGGALSSADGMLVAAVHPFTSSVALFDGETLAPIGDPIPTGDVSEWSTAVLSPDGTRLYTNGPLNNATEWNLDVSTWESIACHAAGRNLTQAEWTTYIDDATYRSTCPEWPRAEDAP